LSLLCPKLVLHDQLLLDLAHAIARDGVEELELARQLEGRELGAELGAQLVDGK